MAAWLITAMQYKDHERTEIKAYAVGQVADHGVKQGQLKTLKKRDGQTR